MNRIFPKILLLTFPIILLAQSGNMNLKMTQGEFNSFRRAKRLYYKGHVDFKSQKYKRASKSFQKCVEIFPKLSEAWFYISKIEYMDGKFQKSLKSIDLAKEHHMFMYQLQLRGQTEYLRNIGGVKRAETGSSVKADKKNLQEKICIPTDYHFHEGNIFMKLRQPDDAYKSYLQAIDSDPENRFAYTNLIALLLRVKKGEEARKFLKMAEDNRVVLNPKLKKAVENCR